jgi:pyrimidine-nucleoside phosphorylase
MLETAVRSGAALEKFGEVIEMQGGDRRVLEHPERLPRAGLQDEIVAPETGYVSACNALDIGMGAMRLGAGRERKEDAIDPAVGVTVLAKPGDHVEAGDPLALISYNDAGRLETARPLLETAFVLTDEPVEHPPLILGEVRS